MVANAINKPGGDLAVKMQLLEKYIDELDQVLGTAKVTVLPEGMSNIKAFFTAQKLVNPLKNNYKNYQNHEGVRNGKN